MASSPPPHVPTISLPKKRPSITLPPNPHPAKRRKGSISSASAHPLRQTSFPPPERSGNASQNERDMYSPAASGDEDDDLDVDEEIASNVGSARGGTSKRGGGGGRGGRGGGQGKLGRPPKSRADTASVADGDTSTVVSGSGGRRGGTAGAGSTTGAGGGGGDEDADEEEDDEGEATALEGGKYTRARQEAEKSRRAMFLSKLRPEHFQRYEQWNRIHLRKDVVRRLTNQTLSQSVPASVITAVNAYTKVFAGEIVDRARSVQREWVAASGELPTGEENKMGDGEGEAVVKERDLGPLLPDHLREALRRYKSEKDGGTVGFTGMSLEGREAAAVRNGGKRLFR